MNLGKTQELKAFRTTDNGCYLVDEDGEEVLLPNAYVSESLKLGDSIEVFVYKDNKQRLTATTLKPKAEIDQFAFLEVKEVNRVGAFLDWGLVKQLMVPFSEQTIEMQVGKSYVVFLLEDEKTERIIGSAKLRDFFFTEEVDVNPTDEVDLLIYKVTDLGFNAIVNNQYQGLVFHSDVSKDIKVGDQIKGFVKRVRPDGKIDLSLHAQGYRNVISSDTQTVLNALNANDGTLTLNDKSSPELIKRELGMSKKAFKRAIGNLYKSRQILIGTEGITLQK